MAKNTRSKEQFVINKLCSTCDNNCKQSDKLLLLRCPQYQAGGQLEIPLKLGKPRKKKA